MPDLSAALTGILSLPSLGRVHGLFDELAAPAVQQMMDEVVDILCRKKARVSDVALPAAFGEVLGRHHTVMAVEAALFHRERLKRQAEDYQPRIRTLLEEGLACPAPEYACCKEHQQRLSADILACFGGVDALLTPATTSPAPDRCTTGSPAFNAPWSYLGLPTVSLPVGLSAEGLPMAIQLVGRPWDEAVLFRTAAWCEEIFAGRIPEPLE
jgi:aspartyl-tRNA(Asn)/glutamyl-tRNA(Gln) amidotransferase subunit A